MTRLSQFILLQKVILILVDNFHHQCPDLHYSPDKLSHPTQLVQLQLDKPPIDTHNQAHHPFEVETLTDQADMTTIIKNSQDLSFTFIDIFIHQNVC